MNMKNCNKCGQFTSPAAGGEYVYSFTSFSLDDSPTGIRCAKCSRQLNTHNGEYLYEGGSNSPTYEGEQPQWRDF